MMSTYTKNRCAQAKTEADWRAIERDVPGAKAAYENAKGIAAKVPVKSTKLDPMDKLCAEDPNAVECKVFDE